MLNILELEGGRRAERVFCFFEEISRIPHGSGNTAAIADYLVAFAKERGLYSVRDGANNVIIRKPATEGYEARPTVILQGHTDMVADATAESGKDLTCDALDLYVDGDFLRAKGTTLGGDDGIAVAYALAILDSSDIPHPEIEAVFTSDEEIGLLGATALDTSELRGRIMINIDSEEEGIFTVGCAGGVRMDITLPMQAEDTPTEAALLRVSGLAGGHSGIEIDKSRGNAIKILGELLDAVLKETGDLRIASISGGNADNAIPRSAECLLDRKYADAARRAIAVVTEKYREVEPCMNITCEDAEPARLYTPESSQGLISLISKEPSGVIAMSEDIEGLVETSLNLGIVESNEACAVLSFSLRSAKGASKKELAERVELIAREHGATCSSRGDYPAWEYRKDSHLREVMCDVFRDMYGRDAQVVTIHAGLECGIFSDKIEGLDCVSIGPDSHDIHTTEEHLSISSAIRVWEYLKEVLKRV